MIKYLRVFYVQFKREDICYKKYLCHNVPIYDNTYFTNIIVMIIIFINYFFQKHINSLKVSKCSMSSVIERQYSDFFRTCGCLSNLTHKGEYFWLYYENKSDRSGMIFLDTESWRGYSFTQGLYFAWTMPLGRNQTNFIRDTQNPIISTLSISSLQSSQSIYAAFFLFFSLEITGHEKVKFNARNWKDICEKIGIDIMLPFY